MDSPEPRTRPDDTAVPAPPPGGRPRRRGWRWLKRTVLLLLALVALIVAFVVLFPKTAQRWAAAGMEWLLPRYLAANAGTGPFVSHLASRQEVKVPMRDLIQLATDLYLPAGPGPFPAIAVRTPYHKDEGRLIADFFVRYGYAVAVQDVRGRHGSEGEFYPFRAEGDDGVDFTRWLKQQPWCDGKIGAFGLSYLGFTQWAMATGNPDLTSIAPSLITANLYHGIYRGGAFGKLTFLHWSLTSHGRYGAWVDDAQVERGYRHFPLVESDDAASQDIPFYNDWVSHPVPDAYWRALSVDHRFSELTAPAFLTAGWYDFFLEGQLRDFALIQKAAVPGVRGRTKLLIGPWNHAFFNGNQQRYGIRQGRLELVPFEFVRLTKEWYDYSLKGIANGWDRRPPVRVYVLGQNMWRDEQEWPPARATHRPYFLHSRGNAQTLIGDGSLDLSPPTNAEPPDSFVFHPTNPVPTLGGSHGLPAACGPADQRAIEQRPDVLVYSTAPLAGPLLVMGPVSVRLFAASTASDTDFTAKLVDVFPDGQALIICEGVIRARYRNGLDQPELLPRGETCALEIAVGNTAVQFQPGHRVRLEISSSNFPRYDPNPNTGTEVAAERNPVPATQRVAHNPEFPSALILPVVVD
jgi:putative CocE/NonD family hydrolase